MLPSASDTANLDLFSLADELSRVADAVKWPRLTEMEQVEKIAEVATAAGECALDGLLDTSATERGHLYHLLLPSKGSWARALRKILEAREGPSSQPGKPRSF